MTLPVASTSLSNSPLMRVPDEGRNQWSSAAIGRILSGNRRHSTHLMRDAINMQSTCNQWWQSEALHTPSVHSQTPVKERTSIKPFLTKICLSDWVKASASRSSRFSLVDWQRGVDHGHQWSSVVINGHQGSIMVKVAINGHQWSSVVLSGPQWSSVSHHLVEE